MSTSASSPAQSHPHHDPAPPDELDIADVAGGADVAPGADELAGDPTGGTSVRELGEVPAVEIITRAAVMLMSAAAERLGLAEDGERYKDLDEARRLIQSLAALVTASAEYLGFHAAPLRDGLKVLQKEFREQSTHPDAVGQGPGERWTGPVY
ncbi:MAG TPA: DUF1844 domain-containing protein [Frankiaceae bacterium]